MSEYKILKVIGKGAFGDAYLGMNIKQQKQYVIKQVDIKNKSKQQKQHIFNQVKLLQQFHHVNIVSYRDSFIDRKGLLNIVMEYCEGGDMNQVIESMQGNKLAQDKILYWLAQMALAIFYMHEKKILHRDLKSPNIFMLKGNIRLGDFGISKVLDHVRDLAQTNIGTPYYMSPQQYNHKPYSYKSDIWAFGCILYEMCNQRRPFEANNIQALGMKVVRGNFPPVSECYSKELRALVGEMLQKNPAKRPNVIEVLLRPFVKKKVIEYMKQIYMKKQTIPKQSLKSLQQQAKKLSVSLQQKKPTIHQSPQQTQRQRSTSKKNLLQQQKQKQKKQRQRKKEQLENELKRHNQERKEMAEKLKKIEEERKALLAKKKSQKSLKSIYEKVQATERSVEGSSGTRPNTAAEFRLRKTVTEQSSKNLIGKVISQVSTEDKSHSQSVSSDKSQPLFNKAQIKKQPSTQLKLPPIEAQIPEVEQKKTFKMQQQYEMQFEDCQPQQQCKFNQLLYEQQQSLQQQQQQQHQSSSSLKQIRQQEQFDIQNRIPTFANDDDKLAQQVKQIRDLVFVSNQAVEQVTKKDFMKSSHNSNGSALQAIDFTQSKLLPAISSRQQKQKQKQKQTTTTQRQKAKHYTSPSHNNKPFQSQRITPTQIQQKVQTLKQQIKNKTQHINSIRNQLSNIDFSLTESEDEQEFPKIELAQKANFKKKQFNPQHAKINDRVNMLKESAVTILGGDMYKKFYQYLVTIKEKGRTVKRDYLQNVLGQEKIGAYHLVEQIVRLTRMLEKIPKWL